MGNDDEAGVCPPCLVEGYRQPNEIVSVASDENPSLYDSEFELVLVALAAAVDLVNADNI